MTWYRPQNHKELFNYRDVWLCNVIKRIFGVVKWCFKVLVITQEYSPKIQSCLVSRLAALHNFIHAYDPSDVPNDAELDIPDVEPAQVADRTTKLAEYAVNNGE